MPGLDRDGGKIHHEVHGAGHAANQHQPAQFNRAVEAFLGGLPKVRE